MLLAVLLSLAAEPAPWPQWRGPTRDGVVRDATPWPDTLDGLRRVWRADDLGPSYSGPIMSATAVYTTATVDKKREVVTAFDRATGKQLWQTGWDGAMEVPFFAAKNGSWIRSTPALDGDRLFVAGMRDVLVCLDAGTGREVWRADLMRALNAPLPAFGCVCSPLVDTTGVYVQAGAAFVKLDKTTGKVLWTTLPTKGDIMTGSAFSSPVFATLGGTDQVVVQTRTDLAGVDRATGKVLWKRAVPSFRGMNILTPQPADGGVFTSTYGGNTQFVRVVSEGGILSPTDGWAARYEGHMTSPVVVGGHAYLLGKDQRAVCFDLKTGQEAWRSDKRFGTYWSLVANRDKLLALDNRGTLFLLRATPAEYDPLAEAKVADAETWAHLAVAGNHLAVRDLTGLSLFDWPAK